MHRFIETPHLPKAKVWHIIIGEKYRDLFESREFLNEFEVLWLPESKTLDGRIAGHCDMSAVHAGGEKLILAEYLRGTEFADRLISLGAKLCYVNDPCGNYPDDAKMNVCAVGKYLFANPKSADGQIVKLLTEGGRQLISCRQGYTKCSVCVVSDDAIITSDTVIADKAAKHGIDCLKICSGAVKLDGYEHGFFGGASFKISQDTLLVCGDISKHPDAEAIVSFAKEHGVTVRSLNNKDIVDIGSAIPLTESI